MMRFGFVRSISLILGSVAFAGLAAAQTTTVRSLYRCSHTMLSPNCASARREIEKSSSPRATASNSAVELSSLSCSRKAEGPAV